MSKGFYNVPFHGNEEVWSYAPGTPGREELQAKYKEMYNSNVEVPMYIGDKQVHTDTKKMMSPPHDHKHSLGTYSVGTKKHVEEAIDAALAAKYAWENMEWHSRAAIFLKAADLLAGPYRAKMNASTMLAQSKNCYQSEIDSVAETIDFLRMNVAYMQQIMEEQPDSNPGLWNRLEYRPLEGFVFAITPFNFTAIAANLCAAPAMLGNVVVWKPAGAQMYSAQVIMEVFKEAGLPDGVINMVTASGPDAGEVVFNHKDFAGLHFTGSTGVFRSLWKTIGDNLSKYRTYPRIVGETEEKILSWHTNRLTLSKVPATEDSNPSDSLEGVGVPPAAVAPEDYVKSQDDAEIVAGGGYDKSKGYFIEPTVIVTKSAKFRTMCEEIFGPVVTIYVYDENKFEETLELVDSTSEYALTGSIFSQDRYMIELASKKLINAAGNFYINDKPTGAVVGQQPFGGARGSGTNDKAGSYLNMLRWVSPRTIKETFVTPTDYRYPFLG
eukprot:maker-scaffold701_size109406-snap-gene-0.1 protein:Tk00494 transcript:maker-scaffold701_size109406-snap-gene-0.1-mRNA-1 annotation:"1-pyrroline-5-carboxylate dehydrogenase"